MNLQKEAGRDCPSPFGARRSAAVKVRRRPPRPPAHAVRADLDGQTAVARWAHQQASPTPSPFLLRLSASEARSAAGAKASAISARMGRDARRLDAQHKSAVRHRRRRTESPNLQAASHQTRRRTKPSCTSLRRSVKARRNRIGFATNARSPADAHDTAHKANHPSRPQRGRCRTRQSAPPKRGAGAAISRPCCATRSGCARRPRLRPGGRRSSPGTTDRPASPRGTDARRG